MSAGKQSFSIFFVTLLCSFVFVPADQAWSQEGDPSDIWLRGYMLMREAEDKEEERRDLEALSKYREAQRLFDYIARTHPSWKSSMMNFRRKSLLDKIEEVHARLKSSNPDQERQFRNQNKGAVASTPSGGSRNGGITVPPNSETPMMTSPRAFSGEASGPVESIGQEFRKLQDQLDRLSGANQRLVAERDQREQLVSSLEEQLEQSRQVEQQIRNQLTQALDDLKAAKEAGGGQRRQLEEQLKLATVELREANTESANILKALEVARMEVSELTKQKNALLNSREAEMERAAQVMAQLEQTAGDRDKARAERDAAKAELARLQAELEEARKQQGEMAAPPEIDGALAERLKESERQNNELMARLKTELEGNSELKAQNQELVAELEKSKETINTLNKRVLELEREKADLEQINKRLLARQDELIKERDLLQKERDEMAILLNASDQIQGDVKDILAANQEWRNQLQAARRKTDELTKAEGNYKAEIETLRTQLSEMQDERDVLRAENQRYQQSVTELNEKLNKMLAELDTKTKALQELTQGKASGKGGAVLAGQFSPEELEGLAGAKAENELLKGIIHDQLVQQARAQQARELVLQELEKMDIQSELLLTSLDEMVGDQINITEEVKKMFKGKDEMKLIEVVESSKGKVEKFASLKTGRNTVGEFPEEGARVLAEGTDPKTLSPVARARHITQLAKAANYDFTRGKYSLASKGYDQILAIEPNNVFSLANMGLIHAQAGQMEKAKDYLNRALKNDRNHAPTHYYLGVLHFKEGKFDTAMKSFGQSLSFDENNANAHNYMGLIATEKGMLSRAESEFRDAVRLDPKHANAHFNLSVLYATRDIPSRDLAKKHYRKARELGASADSAMEDFVGG